MVASAFTVNAAQAATSQPAANPAQKQATTPEKQKQKQATTPSAAVPLKDRDKVLGKGWKTSTDRAVTTAADSDGLHLLTADSTTGYAWKTAAVLTEPQLPADIWIGNSCVMDDHHAAIAYAPRTFTNKQDLMMGGAFTAIVNLDDGRVTKLPFTASLAYFDPTCNPATHSAVFTALRDSQTRLVTVNTKGTTLADTTAKGEITSAVPTKDGVIAAAGNQLVTVDRNGRTSRLTATKHAPYGIRVTGDGTVDYIDRTGDTDANVQTYAHGKKTTVASGKITAMNLRQGTDSTVYLAGRAGHGKGFTASRIKPLDVSPDAEVSTRGRLAVDPVLAPAVQTGLTRIAGAGQAVTGTEPQPAATAASDGPLAVTSTATPTGSKVTQTVVPWSGGAPATQSGAPAARSGASAGANGTAPSPALAGMSVASGGATAKAAATTADHDPVDTDRWCSVPRNDVNAQALQPTPNQVEWAVDMAVRGDLTSAWVSQGGWRSQAGLGTISPQALFPKPSLVGGGSIPAQVELGILAQESNLWQAESGAIPGQMGNPLASVAGFYGHKGTTSSDYWKIDWENSDCGYGVGQVTDGMRLAGHEKTGETSLSPPVQKAVALDYTVNVAASLQILADKWNEVHTAGQTVTVNNDDASKPENWFTAVWNYNLGYNPPGSGPGGPNGPWGLGWYNNPANPIYPAARQAFMDTSLDAGANHDAAHPQDWPYEEKVMGWAAWSIDTGHSYATSGRQDWPGDSGFSSAGFQPSWWLTNGDRSEIKPPLGTFCNESNDCDVSDPPPCETDHIEGCDQLHWWHEQNTVWKTDCADTCGHESIKYLTLRAEPGRGYRLQYGEADCAAVPAGAMVVHSVPNGTPTWSQTCGNAASSGTFQFTFYPDSAGQYEAKGDLSQIGGGYQGHYWYAHTRNEAHLGGDEGRMTVDGTWTLNQSLNQWARVMVHVPDTGAQTQQAHYKIYGIAGKSGGYDRYINQHRQSNAWLSLGVYQFSGTPKVDLSNATDDGSADDDVAWDAVAFQPLPGKPKHIVAALGDSYSSGEGAGNYFPETDQDHGTSTWNACSRSKDAWPRKLVLPGETSTLGSLSDAWSTSAELGFVACSGAKNWNVQTQGELTTPGEYGAYPTDWDDRTKDPADGQFHEMNQMDSGVLDDDTTLVTLTIGGNDQNAFSDAISECASSPFSCGGDAFTAKYEKLIDDAETNILETLKEIRDRATNAEIVLIGYPAPISTSNTCDAAGGAVGGDPQALTDLAFYFAAEDQDTIFKINDTKVNQIDPYSWFTDHEVCDSDSWIKGVSIGPNSEGDFHAGDPNATCAWKFDTCVSRESFHPNVSGTTGYAELVDQELANTIGYTGG
ncbi:SGNH/GDSL hydrolase family protein [Streptomyces sp. CA-111067]|uniref:SGNH/GDSL hydrolase family protein n=1 Tax=Streptomyces sp. CA-111067 TaxID=3240046 RepID=UPI003D993984